MRRRSDGGGSDEILGCPSPRLRTRHDPAVRCVPRSGRCAMIARKFKYQREKRENRYAQLPSIVPSQNRNPLRPDRDCGRLLRPECLRGCWFCGSDNKRFPTARGIFADRHLASNQDMHTTTDDRDTTRRTVEEESPHESVPTQQQYRDLSRISRRSRVFDTTTTSHPPIKIFNGGCVWYHSNTKNNNNVIERAKRGITLKPRLSTRGGAA